MQTKWLTCHHSLTHSNTGDDADDEDKKDGNVKEIKKSKIKRKSLMRCNQTIQSKTEGTMDEKFLRYLEANSTTPNSSA